MSSVAKSEFLTLRMYLFILGALCTQLSYIMIQWLRLRYKEYLLYAAYIFTFILYAVILFQEDVLQIPEGSTAFVVIDSFKRPFAFLLYFEYFLFAQYFIDLKSRFPSYYKILQPLKKIIVAFIIAMIILRIANIQYTTFGNSCYYAFSIFLFIVFIVSIIKLWNSDDQLVKYVLWASTCVCVGAFLSNALIVLKMMGIGSEKLSNLYFLPTCLGAAFEIYFLNTGIVYKVSLSEKKLITTQQELITKLQENELLLTSQQNMRNKIAQDLHDDIGATLSGIALHSHLAGMKISEGQKDEAIKSLNVIRNGASEMVNNLNDVVWTVNPKNDNAGQMLERLKEYALNMAQSKNIVLNWKVEPGVVDIKLPMESRRDIFLVCKEAVNNAVKYSECNEVNIFVTKFNQRLQLTVADNGRGFDLMQEFKGNGLKNMQARARENKMKLDITSLPSTGTSITINYEITQ